MSEQILAVVNDNPFNISVETMETQGENPEHEQPILREDENNKPARSEVDINERQFVDFGSFRSGETARFGNPQVQPKPIETDGRGPSCVDSVDKEPNSIGSTVDEEDDEEDEAKMLRDALEQSSEECVITRDDVVHIGNDNSIDTDLEAAFKESLLLSENGINVMDDQPRMSEDDEIQRAIDESIKQARCQEDIERKEIEEAISSVQNNILTLSNIQSHHDLSSYPPTMDQFDASELGLSNIEIRRLQEEGFLPM